MEDTAGGHSAGAAGAEGPEGGSQEAHGPISTAKSTPELLAAARTNSLEGKSRQAGTGGGLPRATVPITKVGSTCLNKYRKQVLFLFLFLFFKYSTSQLRQ